MNGSLCCVRVMQSGATHRDSDLEPSTCPRRARGGSETGRECVGRRETVHGGQGEQGTGFSCLWPALGSPRQMDKKRTHHSVTVCVPVPRTRWKRSCCE